MECFLWNAFYEWNGEPLLQSEIDDFLNALEFHGLKVVGTNKKKKQHNITKN